MSRLGLAAIVLLALLVGGCGSASQRATPGEGASTAERPKHLVVSAVTVPDVVGLTEREAVSALAAAGLVANIRHADDVPRTGAVYRAVPVAGSEVQDHSVVLLRVSLPPRLPSPGQEHELEIGPLSRLVTSHPDVLVGLYRDQAAVPHIVFGRGADPDEWAGRLTEAAEGVDYPAEGIGYRADTCSHTYARLRAIQDEITTNQDWKESVRLAFGVWVQPETCTVRVESDLLRPVEIEALVERYGTAISFDTTEGSHPVRL